MSNEIKPNYEKEKQIQEENKQNTQETKTHGCLISFCLIAGILIILAIIFFIGYKAKESDNYNNNDSPKLFTRKATLNDLTITGDDLDLASFGEKLIFNPKYDIENLSLKFIFQKSNGEKLQTITKTVGNVIEGTQYSITIGLTELSWEVIKNVFDIQCKYTVSSGTISYFQ